MKKVCLRTSELTRIFHVVNSQNALSARLITYESSLEQLKADLNEDWVQRDITLLESGEISISRHNYLLDYIQQRLSTTKRIQEQIQNIETNVDVIDPTSAAYFKRRCVELRDKALNVAQSILQRLVQTKTTDPHGYVDVQPRAFLKQALIIGQHQYEDHQLMNADNDAKLMSKTLKALGFIVYMIIDGTRKQIQDSVVNFGQELTHKHVAVFYFSGHGFQLDGANYLVPVNFQRDIFTARCSPDKWKLEAVSDQWIQDILVRAGLTIQILDACRSIPIIPNDCGRSFVSKGLAKQDPVEGGIIIYSTGPNSIATGMEDPSTDKAGHASVFTSRLVHHLRTGNIPVEEVVRRTRVDVKRLTQNRQVPWHSSSMSVNFVFNTIKQPAASPPSANQQTHGTNLELFLGKSEAEVNQALFTAASSGNLNAVKYLVQNVKVDVNQRNKDGDTEAARTGKLDVVKWLVEEGGAKVNQVDNVGETPLHEAAGTGKLDVVKWLVEEGGAKVNQGNELAGWTPLHKAAFTGKADVVKWLGETPLHKAAGTGEVDVVEWLVEEGGANVNQVDNVGGTPLHKAVKNGEVDVVKFLESATTLQQAHQA